MVSTSTISQYTRGVFPAGKKDLIRRAQTNRAPQDVIETLQKLPDGQFDSMSDVWKAIGNVE